MGNAKKNYAPVGVFDSGVGGLTVAREIMRQLPEENVVYFGDTARVPYGSKSKNNIIRFSRQIIRFLQTKEVKAIVIACNTASALALETVQKEMAVLVRELMETGRDGDMERFICVMSADMHGRARPMRPEAEKNLQAVSESLRRLYQKASSVRLSEVPEFAAALSEFKAKKISVAELHRRQNEIMERLLFAEAKTG